MALVTCVDVGSTFTKAALADTEAGVLLETASEPTTAGGGRDVMDGLRAARARVEQGLPGGSGPDDVLVCSSAGGGLRIAVVGYERDITAEAGRRVALSAGGRVVHVAAGPLVPQGVRELRAARPDVLLLAGGTDGGNAEVLLHNASALARARVAVPVVLAGNAQAAQEAAATLTAARRTVVVTANVLPRIGSVEPAGARAAIREVFLRHVIGGKGLSRGPAFARLVRAATPDAVLAGVEALAAATGQDVLVVDVGGATTDVYSVLTPQGEDATIAREAVAPLWHARTVEGDLGMRWSAPGVVTAARSEGLPVDDALRAYADRVHADPGSVPSAGDAAADADEQLAILAATVAVRRHGRPGVPGRPPRPLRDVSVLVGSGGALRHAPAAGERVLAAVLADHAGGWQVPDRARAVVDRRYALFAAGLLAGQDGTAGAALAATVAGVAGDGLQTPAGTRVDTPGRRAG